MKRFIFLALLVIPSILYAQDLSKAAEREYVGDVLAVDSRTPLTGTWTCTTTSLTCTSASGNAQTELNDLDIVELCGYRYVVDGEPADPNSIKIKPHRDPTTGALRSGADGACATTAGSKVNGGITTTMRTVNDGKGTDSPLTLSTTGVASTTTLTSGVAANNTGGTGQGGGNLISRINTANGALSGINLYDTYNPTTGQTGSKPALSFFKRSTIDGGSTYQDTESFRIYTADNSSWYAASGPFLAGASLHLMSMYNGTMTDALYMSPYGASFSGYIASTTFVAVGSYLVVGSGNLTAGSGVNPDYFGGVNDFTWTGNWTYTTIGTWVGASHTGSAVIATLPAKTVLKAVYLIVTTPGVSSDATYTIALGSAGAAYNQLLTTADLKAAANTVYGDADAERGTDLPDADVMGAKLYSYAATQAITAYFNCGGINCNAAGITAGAWKIIFVYTILP